MEDVPHIACHFWGTKDELTIDEGILLKGNRICIHPELYPRTLHDMHYSHQGVEKMTHLERAHIYWPGIDAEIIEYVKCCTICTRHKASQTVQSMLPRDIPDGPWQELATDYFTHYSKDYLLITNPFSKYPFIYKVHSKTTDSLTHVQDLFSQYGMPKQFSPIMDPLFL